MTTTNTLNKVLPRTETEIGLEITAKGSAGEDLTVQIALPDVTLSDGMADSYRTHRFGTDGFWFEVMEDALRGTNYRLSPVLYKSESGTQSLQGCSISFDYYHEARIGDLIETILKRIDAEIVLENRKRATENQQPATTQDAVVSDIAAEIGTRDLTVDNSQPKPQH